MRWTPDLKQMFYVLSGRGYLLGPAFSVVNPGAEYADPRLRHDLGLIVEWTFCLNIPIITYVTDYEMIQSLFYTRFTL